MCGNRLHREFAKVIFIMARMLSHSWLLSRLLGLTAITVCLQSVVSSQEVSGRPKVFVSIPPQAYFVEMIAGPTVDVEVLLPPGQSPTTYEPTPLQMIRLAESDLFIGVGVPFEQRLLRKLKASLTHLDYVDTREGIKLRMISHHRHAGESTTGIPDPHIWLDPVLVKIQSENVCRALSHLDSSRIRYFEQNLKRLHYQLDSLDTAIREILAPVRGRRMFVFHPSYGYFADAYGLQQVAVETEGKEPSIKQLAEAVGAAKEVGAKALFVQPQFSAKEVQTMAHELGGSVVLLDPLARDYVNNLLGIAKKIATALGADDIQAKEPSSGVTD